MSSRKTPAQWAQFFKNAEKNHLQIGFIEAVILGGAFMCPGLAKSLIIINVNPLDETFSQYNYAMKCKASKTGSLQSILYISPGQLTTNLQRIMESPCFESITVEFMDGTKYFLSWTSLKDYQDIRALLLTSHTELIKLSRTNPLLCVDLLDQYQDRAKKWMNCKSPKLQAFGKETLRKLVDLEEQICLRPVGFRRTVLETGKLPITGKRKRGTF